MTPYWQYAGLRRPKEFWDEENRLMAVIDNKTLSKYTHDAVLGERVVKSSGVNKRRMDQWSGSRILLITTAIIPSM